MFERYSFVALTTADLGRSRRFWVEQLGFTVTDEQEGEYFIIDAGGLRLCVDTADGDIHVAGGKDPVLGFKVGSLPAAIDALREQGVLPERGPTMAKRGAFAILRDPDGRAIIVTEVD